MTKCPQCNGSGFFMSIECFTCDGRGKINTDDM